MGGRRWLQRGRRFACSARIRAHVLREVWEICFLQVRAVRILHHELVNLPQKTLANPAVLEIKPSRLRFTSSASAVA